MTVFSRQWSVVSTNGGEEPVTKFTLLWLLATVFLTTASIAEAQQQKVHRIGILGNSSLTDSSYHETFRQRLRELTYVEGKNIVIEYRWAEGKLDRLPTLAAELVHLKVDILVTTGTPATRAVKLATQKIPIVFVVAGDPVETRLVESLSRPGANLTGLQSAIDEVFGGKRVELLKDTVPAVSRVAVLRNPDTPTTSSFEEHQRNAAKGLGLQLSVVEVKTPRELDSAFTTITKTGVGGVIVDPTVFFGTHHRRVVELAAKDRVPAVYGHKQAVEAGGLLFYGASLEENWRRAAIYVDKILRGAKPADLPIERPTKFEFIINLKTAKQIGLTIPPNVLARADRVIR
jgi:ABC-type uncharacterized transport system substrate-binding protein